MRTILFHIPLNVTLVLGIWIAVCLARLAWVVFRRGWTKEIAGELPVMAAVALAIAFVLPGLADESGLPIRGYGAMVFLGVVAGVALAAFRARREGFDPEIIYSLAFWMCLGGIIGARLFYVVEYWRDFQKATFGETVAAIINFTRGGLVVYGCFAGGAVAAIIFFVRHKLPILAMADVIAPAMTLGLALGRVGCFLNGCCYGGQCTLPWAVQFPTESPVFESQLERGQFVLYGIHFQPGRPSQPHRAEEPSIVQAVDENSAAAEAGVRAGDRVTAIEVTLPDQSRSRDYLADEAAKNHVPLRSIAAAQLALARIEEAGTKVSMNVIDAQGSPAVRHWTLSRASPAPSSSLPVHPAQLYSAIDALLITLFLLAWHPFRRHAGELIALLLTIYPVTRFFEEMIRTDELPVFGTGMSISQNASILMLAGAVVLWIYVLRSPRISSATT
jgi:phosphatidylglycerol:prolipoprotein diacylglycerol transferase